MTSPLALYQSKLTQGEIQPDTLQKKVVLAFESLYNNIHKTKYQWFFKSTRQFNGLYIYGSVGRGKTFLMDLFVASIDTKTVRRIHFHTFMLWLHQELRLLKKQQHPVDLVIKKLSKQISVLCLDEFLVHDITDAMLLARILLALEKYQVSLITTSNVKPINLYVGGLQRKRFIPAIAWMQEKMHIIQLDGEYDYRKQETSIEQKWLSPITTSNQNKFALLFSQLVGNEKVYVTAITINKRTLNVIKRSNQHIMFEFKELCEGPRNANDYIQLAKGYKSIFLLIPKEIAPHDRNIARRFITLVDVLYDANTSLYVLSAFSFNHIYQGDELSFEIQRTISRLMHNK